MLSSAVARYEIEESPMSTNALPKRIIIAVDLDYFFAQCEEVRHPELKKKPVVVCVYSGRTEYSGVVSTANYFARDFGVKSGIPIVNARKLLAAVPEAIFLPIDPEYYEEISDRVMQMIRSYSGMFEKVSIDEAFIDISSTSHGDYVNAAEIGKRIKSEIKNQASLTCSIGIAPNKLLAKMSADSKKPDGIVVLPPDQVESYLKDLAVRKLIGVGPKVEAKMKFLGIRTISDLSVFDESRLSEEFGRNIGPRFKLLARGIDEDPVRERQAEQYSRIITLKTDADSFSFAEELKPLAQDISNRLRTAKRRCRTIGVIYITTTIKLKNRTRTFNRWIDSAEEILDEVSQLFEQLFASKELGNMKVRRVGLRVSGLSDETTKLEAPASLADYFEKV